MYSTIIVHINSKMCPKCIQTTHPSAKSLWSYEARMPQHMYLWQLKRLQTTTSTNHQQTVPHKKLHSTQEKHEHISRSKI